MKKADNNTQKKMTIDKENFQTILDKLHHLKNQKGKEGYAAGNLINLLIELEQDLTQYDFSGLKIENAILQGKGFQGINLSECKLSQCALIEDFSTITSIDFSGNQVVAGTTSGAISVWNIDESERIASLTGHNDWVWAISFSPNGKLIASGSGDETVRLWDIRRNKNKQQCHLWSDHQSRVRTVAFSPDGTLLVSGDEDGKVNLYDLESCQLRISLNKEGWANSIEFSPDGHLLAVGSQKGTVHVWNISKLENVQTLKIFNDFEKPIRSIKFSPNGQLLGIAGDAKEIWLVDINTWESVQQLTGYKKASIRAIDFTPDGENIAGGGLDSQIRIWNVKTGKIMETLTGHEKQVRAVAFNSDKENLKILSAAEDQTLRLWEIEYYKNQRKKNGDKITGKCIKIIQGYNNPIWSLAFSSTKPFLITGDEENQVLLWELSQDDLTKVIPKKLEFYCQIHNNKKISITHSNLIRKVAFNKDGSWLAIGSYDGTAIALDLTQKTYKDTYQCVTTKLIKANDNDSDNDNNNNRVISVNFHPTKKIIAICYYYGEKVDLWDFDESGKSQIIQTIDLLDNKGKRSRGRDVAFSPDGQILAISSEENFIRLYDWENQTYLPALKGHQAPVWSIAFREEPENNEILASCDAKGEIRIWNIETSQSRKLEGHTSRLRSIAFSPDYQKLVSGGDDGTVKIWNIKSGECLKTFSVPETWIWSVSFSYDGQMIAHSNDNGTAQIWDVNTEQCIATLRPERPYEGMNITGIDGLTTAQIEMLKQLGAVED